METLRESTATYRTVFAMFTAVAVIASALWLATGTSKAASLETVSIDNADSSGSLTVKDWQLLSK